MRINSASMGKGIRYLPTGRVGEPGLGEVLKPGIDF